MPASCAIRELGLDSGDYRDSAPNSSSGATATLSYLAQTGPKLPPIVKWTVTSPPPTKHQSTALAAGEFHDQ